MKNAYGYAGNIVYVNLTEQTIKKEPLDKELAKTFIGGMGINSKLAYELVKPGTEPFSPENVLIFGAGPLVGTLAPGSSRTDATSKSPLTGFLGMANAGISVGAMLKYAGYDHLVITGRAEKPIYLKVFDDNIEILDASHLWGKDLWETTDAIWSELGDCWVSCIGPGGENLVRYASIMNNKRAGHSRAGLGAVMGSKNLKAIAARGTKGIEVADGKKFMELVNELLERIMKSPLVEMWRNLGFTMAFEGYSAMGYFLAKNFSQGCLETPQVFSQKEYRERIVKRSYACLGCPIGCKNLVEIEDGKYAGLTFRVSSLGSQVGYHLVPGVENWDEVVKCVELENRYGLDSTSLCGTIAFAIELYERGIITREDTGGLELKWGAETVKTLIEKIACREGIGDLLAEGVVRASKRFGKGSEKYAFHIKGLETPLGVRGRLSTENFGQITNPRGGHLERSPSITFAPRKAEAFKRYCPAIGVPEEAVARVCEGPENFNVARLTKWVEDYNTVQFCLGMCHRTPLVQHLDLDILVELYSAATGIETSRVELQKAGERVWNIQKAFNVREGASRRDDMPPKRSLSEPILIGGKEYGPIKEEEMNTLLDQYYEEREWDIEKGVPTKQKLADLGLEDIGQDLERTVMSGNPFKSAGRAFL